MDSRQRSPGHYSAQPNYQNPQPLPSQPVRDSMRAPSVVARLPQQRNFNPLLRLPIATQLTLGFMIAAVVAALGAGITGSQRANSLDRQSGFYQTLLKSNTSLNAGNSYLQLMNIELHNALTDATSSTPTSSIKDHQTNLTNLTTLYDAIVNSYLQNNLVKQHSDQLALLTESNHDDQVQQQGILAGSTARTWRVYRAAQDQVVQYLLDGDIASAQNLERLQGEVTNADASSALRGLIQLNGSLARSVRDAASIEAQAQSTTTIVATIITFLTVVLIGWLISSTLVRRLGRLRRVTQLVEEGEMGARVEVQGHDELAKVSDSVNVMLDTIVGLLQETRRQRDALTAAADRLFSDMRVAGAGDLRVNATVSNDPIGLLGNAFNLTVGRFRRFILRTQTTIEQLDVIARRETRNTQTIFSTLQQARAGLASGQPLVVGTGSSGESANPVTQNPLFITQMNRARDLVYTIAQEGASAHTRAVLELAEEAYLSASRLNQLVTALPEARNSSTVSHLAQLQMQEMSTLETSLRQLGSEAFAVQKSSAAGLGDLYNTLEQLSATVRASTVMSGSGASRPVAGQPPALPGSRTPMPDIMNVATHYAQDIAELSHELTNIIQEMRTGIAPFRIEAPEGNQFPAAGVGYRSSPAYEE